MTPSIAIVGCGGLGREALWILQDMQKEQRAPNFAGFVCSKEPPLAPGESLGGEWLGADDEFLSAPSAQFFVVAIGDPRRKMEVAERYLSAGLEPFNLIHPSAVVGRTVSVGEGSLLGAHASLSVNIQVGAFVRIDRASTVGHDCAIEKFASVNPGTVISGDVSIGLRVEIGANACVLPGIAVGDDAVVGAGAVVTRNVEANLTVMGVPAVPTDPRA